MFFKSKKPEPVKIDDEFAKNLGAKDLNDLKLTVSKQIENQFKATLDLLTKKEILELFPSIDSEKITVTYEASDMEIPSSDMMNKVFTEFPELPKNYLLSLGTLEPRKNLKRLIKAFRNLRRQGISQ